jgi:ABC-type nitrate/sulfonate/bicarbonate transport system substrate-binding protein
LHTERLARRAFLAAGGGVLLAPAIAHAQTAPRSINYGLTSKSASDWVAFLGEKLGFFTANGVKPEFVVAGSAAANAQQLTAGSSDMAGISATQLIEAVEGGAPLQAILNRTHTTPYVIVGKKGIAGIKGLAGKMVIVGGPNDITTILMNGVLAGNGMKPENVTYTFAGGTPERFAALMSGAVDAAILLPPFSFRATAQGYPQLAEVSKYFGTFPLDLVGTNATFAKTKSDVLEGYLRGYLQGVRWIYDSANRAQALAILTEATNTTAEDAAKTYDAYVRGRVFNETGLTPIDGMDKVVATLLSINAIKPPAPRGGKFVDNTFVQHAAAQLRTGPASRRT